MKCIRILIVLMAIMFGQGVAFAQDAQTEETHAHSISQKWKGINVHTEVLDQSQYDPILVDGKYTGGKTIFLYNMGTGKFIIEGGNFGMEGRLFHEDFGRPLYLFSDGYITSGITENGQKYLFGCNIPAVFHSQGNWNNWNQYSFTIMMDADKSKRNKGWQFKRVEGETGDTCTYYLYEDKNGKQYYLGAAWGECHASAWKGDGQYVPMDADRCTWTSANPVGNMNKKEVDGDMIAIDELYKWRVVSEEEFIAALSKEKIGLNPSISIFVPDRDFTRNANNFDTNWVMEDKPDEDYSETGRLGYTFGVYLDKKNQKQYNNNSIYYRNEAWNKPIRLKNVFDNSTASGGPDLAYGWENAKNGFLSFEGVGRTYTTFKVPKPGWYQVQCYGFVQSNAGNDAYLFAKVVGGTEASAHGGEARNNLVTVAPNSYGEKNDREKCLVVGNLLRKPTTKEPYKNTVWICVTDDEYNSGKHTLQVGVGKDQAAKSTGVKNGNTTYYYDSDWVCIDDIRVSYLGTSPAFFYEEEENLDYLIPGSENTKQFETSSPSSFGGPQGQYGGAVCIERSLKTGQWNSFSFPLPLTGEQMRHAFGEDAHLAKIHSIGKMSKNPNVIDFKTVSLRTTDEVVSPDSFYLLKPTMEPTTGIDPRGRNTKFYELGRFFFSVNENESEDYKHEILPLGTLKKEEQAIESLDSDNDGIGDNDGISSVNYVQTPGFSSFTVSGEYIYNGSTDVKGIYAPKGSYVVSNNTILHLTKDTRIKGFRGWIELNQPLTTQSKDFTMEVFGMFDEVPEEGGTTSVPRIHLFTADESVYDLYGRKMGKLGDTLPKGIYIVKGKKYMVK